MHALVSSLANEQNRGSSAVGPSTSHHISKAIAAKAQKGTAFTRLLDNLVLWEDWLGGSVGITLVHRML